MTNTATLNTSSKRERETETDRQTDRQRQADRQAGRENSNSKKLFYRDCSLGSVKNLTTSHC